MLPKFCNRASLNPARLGVLPQGEFSSNKVFVYIYIYVNMHYWITDWSRMIQPMQTPVSVPLTIEHERWYLTQLEHLKLLKMYLYTVLNTLVICDSSDTVVVMLFFDPLFCFSKNGYQNFDINFSCKTVDCRKDNVPFGAILISLLFFSFTLWMPFFSVSF